MESGDHESANQLSELRGGSLQMKNGAGKLPARKFRVRHHREGEAHKPILLQNRAIDADSAEHALRIIIGDPSVQIELMNESVASATRKSKAHVDFWDASPDSET
jgi:hypothetical protein